MPPSDGRSYDSLAIDTSNYVIAVCFTQRRIPFLAASWMAERLCKRLSYFIDGNLETHAHYTSFFLYEVCLIQKSNLNQRYCFVYGVRQCTLTYGWTHRHIYVYIKNASEWFMSVSPCFYTLLNLHLPSFIISGLLLSIISHFKVFKCSFGKGKCLV